jgi:hypothetical protein
VQLAKPHPDVGLFCRNTQASRAFYEQSIGLPYETPVSTSSVNASPTRSRATSPGLVASAHQTLVRVGVIRIVIG